MRLDEKIKQEYEKILITRGEDYFYKYSIGFGFMERIKNQKSDILMLDKSEAFFALYRQTGNYNFFIIGRILRKAAHRLYRDRVKSMDKPEFNNRFLYLVK